MPQHGVILGVNIDHVATLRQARRGHEPDPVRAAHEAELGGADCITVHLREDRRHINDRDVDRLRVACNVRLNLEMAATDEMVEIARELRPHAVAIVPEGRDEVTTEGGLDVAGQRDRMAAVVAALSGRVGTVSAFIDADERHIAAAGACGFHACEVHTGPYAGAFHAAGGDFRNAELATTQTLVAQAGRLILESGMRFNAGHGLNYHNVRPIAALPGLSELHIGHSIVSRAVYTGLRAAVSEMRAQIDQASGRR
ncbi:MAG: pyridoxine 5'-phosphate synthase [Phycisphaeraceae bacterium]|nr:pyridoxine 5'-phosphate synthase [Phycisphaeraceae bacterium]MCB9848870.1 pyridoxine 5'-phosphate synthase [Phycisphaeraceae bacterium]